MESAVDRNLSLGLEDGWIMVGMQWVGSLQLMRTESKTSRCVEPSELHCIVSFKSTLCPELLEASLPRCLP